MNDYDLERLRSDLKELYGIAMMGSFPQAMMEYSEVENASDSELLSIARRNGIDVNSYID